MRRLIILIVVLALCLTLAAHATRILRVKTDGNDNNDGLSWATAKQHINAALGDDWFPDEVWVKKSTQPYTELVHIYAGEKLYGGFVGGTTDNERDPNPASNTTISGTSLNGSVVTFTEPYGAGWELVDGFTIENGIGTLVNGYRYGGGIYCTKPFTVSNNIIQSCTAASGAGIYCSGSAIAVIGNVIQNNTANGTGNDGGGGIHCGSYSSSTITGNTFDGNTGPYGAGILVYGSSPTISVNTFKQNHATYSGGGIFVPSGSPTISGNVFQDGTSGTPHNSAGLSNGGGICIYSGGTPDVTLNTISGCTAPTGGGIYCGAAGTASGNLITSCSASSYGAGIYLNSTSDSTYVTNNTIANNTGGDGVGIRCGTSGTHGTISNNIIASNTVGIYSTTTPTPTVQYNDSSGNSSGHNYWGVSQGTGGLSSEPYFVDGYHLRYDSPCINTGYNSATGIPSTDIEGVSRPQLTTVDMGAYEFVPAVNITTDSNNDLTIASSDDAVETEWPGRMLKLNDDSDSTGNEDDLAEVDASYEPVSTTPGMTDVRFTFVVTSGNSNIRVWSTAQKDTEITSSTTYIIGTNDPPASVWVEGIGSGEGVLDMVMKTSAGAELCRDQVKLTVNSYRISYGSNGSRTVNNANGTSTTYTYDERYRLTDVRHFYTSNDATFAEVQYEVDPVGNRTEMQTSSDGSSFAATAYGYDAMNRLTSATYPGQSATNFTYDWVGNRNPAGSSTYIYNLVDEMFLSSNPSNSYHYSAAGSLESIDGSPTRTFTYDPREPLSTVEN